jgi:hypothetical protein
MTFITNPYRFGGGCLTYSEDFTGCTTNTCDGLIPTGSTSIFWVDTSTDLWKTKISRGAEIATAFDFSSTSVGTLDDNMWNIRFPYKVTASSHTGGGSVWVENGVGIIGSSGGLYNSSEKSLYFYHYQTTSSKLTVVGWSNLGTSGTVSFTNYFTTGTQYYIELIKESSTLLTMNLYSDSGYSTLIETRSIAISSSITGQNYMKKSRAGTSVYVGAGNIEAEISEFTISNGVVTPC